MNKKSNKIRKNEEIFAKFPHFSLCQVSSNRAPASVQQF